MHALQLRVYIYARPSLDSGEIGSLRLGRSVALRSKEPAERADCDGSWRAVKPEGWVCVDERSATLKADHALLVAKHAVPDAPFRWGESRLAPLYRKLPSPKEQQRSEYELDKHLGRVARLREIRANDEPFPRFASWRPLRGIEPDPAPAFRDQPVPAFLAKGAITPSSLLLTPREAKPRVKFVPTRSMVSWQREFRAEGRTWLLTPDLLVIPKDRVVPFEPSQFRGVHLGGDAQLPLTFIRHEPKPKYVLEGAETTPAALVEPSADVDPEEDPFRDDPRGARGRLRETNETWPRLAAVGLTGRARWQRGKRYLETKDDGYWIRAKDATVVRRMPPRGIELARNEKWLDVWIHRGTLVAYEGETPVFATLISPGLHGYRREKNGEPAKGTTPTGTFRIEWKHRSTTMTPDPVELSYYLTDVPHTQFFHMPYALHAAYWHDRFGEPKSGGCVNLSPSDAAWLFGWTSPTVPKNWYSVRSGSGRGEGTWVRVR